MPNRPKSKAGQLADLLLQRMESGEWAGGLPPERSLAREYFVSRTTLREALKMLAVSQAIRPPSSTRSGRMPNSSSKAVSPPAGKGEVVILTPSLRESPLLLEHLAVLREWLGEQGILVHVREATTLLGNPQPANSLKRWAKDAPRTVWILHKMPRAVQQAAVDLKLRAIVFGSVFSGISLPHADVDFQAVARHAAGRCLARGHRNLAVLVHRTQLAGDRAIIESISAELAQRGCSPPLLIKHDFNRARLIASLDELVVPRSGRPDVLLIANQHHLLTALPHLLHRGLRIPQDLSVVYLSNDPAAERLSPLPDRYDLGDQLLRRLAKAALEYLSGGYPASSLLLPSHVKGETFA